MKKQRTELPIQRVAIAGGLKVSYIELGTGPTLVLVPGLFQNVNGLRHLITALSTHFRVICLAVPGSEGSSFLPVGNHKTISENIKWWLEEALTALGVQRALFVTVSLGALLALPTIVGSKRIVVDGYVAHELVTRLADARIWWRLLYRINRLLYDARVGFLSLMMLVAIRFLLARVFRLRFAQALLRTPVRAFPKIGDALSREPTDHLAVQASIAVPTLVVLGSRGTWWLIGQRSVRKVVEQMSSAVRDTLLGAEHFLRKPDQEELAKRIVRFAREHGILPPE